MASTPFISICTIFRDEERFLPGFLDAIESLADELILVDTGSVDRSLEILRERGLIWHSFPWVHDFSKARNYCLSLATGDWIFVMDVDDRIHGSCYQKLRLALRNLRADAVHLNYASTQCLDWSRPVPQIKALHSRIMLFRNHQGYHYSNAIHETPVPSIEEKGGVLTQLDFTVFHLGYVADLEAEKNERNRRMIHEAFEGGDRSPRMTLNYVLCNWQGDETSFDLLKEAYEEAGAGLQSRITETLTMWLLDFRAEDPRVENWIIKLRSSKPDSLVPLFQKARQNFVRNQAEKSQENYHKIYTRLSCEPTLSRYRSEVLYRLGFLFAAGSNFQASLDYFQEYEDYYGLRAVVHHQRLKILVVTGRQSELESESLRVPPDWDSLAVEKKCEVILILKHLGCQENEDPLKQFISD
jgi:glycosyltransferase involved in cell wall biosynthesis